MRRRQKCYVSNSQRHDPPCKGSEIGPPCEWPSRKMVGCPLGKAPAALPSQWVQLTSMRTDPLVWTHVLQLTRISSGLRAVSIDPRSNPHRPQSGTRSSPQQPHIPENRGPQIDPNSAHVYQQHKTTKQHWRAPRRARAKGASPARVKSEVMRHSTPERRQARSGHWRDDAPPSFGENATPSVGDNANLCMDNR